VKRHLAIGDIHGCSDALAALIAAINLRPDDTVVCLGDYVDRGPDTAGVIEQLLELGKSHEMVALRGNHEIMMLDAMVSASWYDNWLRSGVGGRETLLSYSGDAGALAAFSDIPDTHMHFLENELLPYYESETHIFVHASLDADKPLREQADPTLYWRRFRDDVQHVSGKTMVCGHTTQVPVFPAANEHSICIDTWPYGEGWLTCLDVASGVLWQARQTGETRQLPVTDL